MQSVADLKKEIEREFADLLAVPYPRFSDSEMERRDRAADQIRKQLGLDVLLIVEALRAGSATGWFTGWPVTAEAVTVILPETQRRMYIQH
jgi:Xaa-Pro dipeptidase